MRHELSTFFPQRPFCDHGQRAHIPDPGWTDAPVGTSRAGRHGKDAQQQLTVRPSHTPAERMNRPGSGPALRAAGRSSTGLSTTSPTEAPRHLPQATQSVRRSRAPRRGVRVNRPDARTCSCLNRISLAGAARLPRRLATNSE